MLRTSIFLTVAAAGLLGLAACGDREDDVVQAPAPGAAPEPVSETRAATVEAGAALALGMTRKELEDADLLSPDNTDLGDVETLVLDSSGALTHVVIELEGGAGEVAVPMADVRSIARNDGADKDLVTDLTVAQLSALPRWTRPAGA